LLGQNLKSPPAEENVEALCQFFNTVGKQLEENPKSRPIIDSYFASMKQLTNTQSLASRMRFMVRDVLDLRANKWIPRREEVGFYLFSYMIIGNEDYVLELKNL
jgi:translation initiation factor 4G